MATFDDLTLEIPRLWEKDWKRIVDDSDGVEKQLLIFESHGAHLLEHINDFTATPERIAWLNIWSKTFSAIDSALTSLQTDSHYVLKVLSRVVFETKLHVLTILEAVLNIYQIKKSKHRIRILATSETDSWKEAQNRICAYAAWGLWNDKQLILEQLDPGRLDRVWDPNPVHEIVKDPGKREVHETLFGPLKLETEVELLVQRRRQEKSLRKTEERLRDWLNDPKLIVWHEKLRNSYELKHRELTFFELLNENEKTIRRKLKNLNLDFSYPSYKQGSMIIHGSTFEQFYYINEMKLTPLFVILADDIESSALSVASTCNIIFACLYLLQKQLWSDS